MARIHPIPTTGLAVNFSCLELQVSLEVVAWSLELSSSLAFPLLISVSPEFVIRFEEFSAGKCDVEVQFAFVPLSSFGTPILQTWTFAANDP
jgi:hypothetical protein